MGILSIRIENIDLAGRKIYLPKTKTGTGFQEITQSLADFLAWYLDNCCNDGQVWLFPCQSSRKSKTGHTTSIRKAYRRVVKNAGLDPDEVFRHTLRHTFCSHLVQAGVDIPTAKRLSRHKTTVMFERYAHQDSQHIRAAMDKLESHLLLFKPKLEAFKQ